MDYSQTPTISDQKQHQEERAKQYMRSTTTSFHNCTIAGPIIDRIDGYACVLSKYSSRAPEGNYTSKHRGRNDCSNNAAVVIGSCQSMSYVRFSRVSNDECQSITTTTSRSSSITVEFEGDTIILDEWNDDQES